MSFPNNNFWLPNGSGSVANGEICYNTSARIDQKRPHQWFMDSSEQELFLAKKQAVESFKETRGSSVMENSLWHDGSGFQSEGQTASLFCPKPVRGLNVSDKDIPSMISASMNMEKKGFENQFGNDPSICLTMSQAVEDPLCLNNGHRKVKVNEVTISENSLPEFVQHTFCPGVKTKIMGTTFERTGNNMFPGSTYDTVEGNTISVGPAYNKIDKNFGSAAQSSSKSDGNFMLANQYYSGIDNNVLSIGPTFNRGNYDTNSVGEQYEKQNGNFTSICPTFSRGHEDFFVLDPFYGKVNESFMAADLNKGDTDIAFSSEQDTMVVYSEENSSILSSFENSKGEETTISFGGFQNNIEEGDHSGKPISSSYDVLPNQSSGQSSGASGQNNSADQPSANVTSATSSKAEGSQKNKVQKAKKGSSNNFPTNVKSLLSTGMLDGVPVKYVSWSREKTLRGVVKGTGYLCSCPECKLSKAINAYEFERHAGCKTKHPNNHIYFENGKTIYAVVQELKSTPQETLFDVIQNVTGSPVNQKSFNSWKASYKVAARELERIFGKDDAVATS